jgi:hypothetical protein
MLRASLLALLCALTLGSPAAAQPVSTAFTYQGTLSNAGSPYVGSFDLRVSLHPDAISAVELNFVDLPNQATDAEGRFTATLDFALTPPPGAHLALYVRTPHDPTDTAPFTLLTPRQPVTATPFSLYTNFSLFAEDTNNFGSLPPSSYRDASLLSAGTLPSARLSGTYSNPVGFTNPGNAISGSGAALTALNAGNITTGTLSPARGGTGSSVTSATIGHVLKWNGFAFSAQPDTDTNTTYSAGAGLALTGTTFSIPGNAVTSTMLVSDANALAKVSGGTLTSDGTNVTATNRVFANDFVFNAVQTSYLMISQAAFVGRDGIGVRSTTGSGGASPDASTASGIAAPVNLPHGCTITAIDYYVVDNNAADLTCALLTQAPGSNSFTILASTTSSGASTSVQTRTVSPLSIAIDNSTTSYQVIFDPSATWSDATMTVKAVRITYTLPRPAR